MGLNFHYLSFQTWHPHGRRRATTHTISCQKVPVTKKLVASASPSVVDVAHDTPAGETDILVSTWFEGYHFVGHLLCGQSASRTLFPPCLAACGDPVGVALCAREG
ncbi:hypothetical protein BDW42DRAFT_179629 [Aspergillus taichungensis]|uniref:Uncharacterized protein n=1 Tax=Aspergillus taichungensis TaxID=482145 RepID=A0A2J5HGH2_9EURO|nr:hypothetical protein BDW42DRAFT_179629 [Aspergillus taichungensis]